MQRAYIVLIFGVICLGFSAIFVSWANAPGAVAGFYRMAVALVVLAWPFFRRLRRQTSRGKLNLSRRAIGLALLGGFLFSGDLILWNTGVLLSGATNPTVMGNMAPIWVGLGALIFFHERLPPAFWLGLFLALSGAVLILGLDVLEDFSLGLGTLMGLGAGIFYGSYFLVTQSGRTYLDALTYFWLAALSTCGTLLVAIFILGQPLLGYSTFTYASLLGLGLVSQVMGQFAFSYALGYLPASVVAPAGLGQPVVTAILAGPLLGQTPGTLQVAGGAAVIAGVYIVHRSRLAPPSADAAPSQRG